MIPCLFRSDYRLALATLVAAGAFGCGDQKRTYPVRGQFIWEDTNAPAKELAGGNVMFQSDTERMTAQGPIDESGRFVVSTYKAGDGAVAGKHKIAIGQPVSDYGDRPPVEAAHKKYESISTTDLEVTVEPHDNDFRLKIAPGAWMKKKQSH
jgi:hypothetical protein